MDSSVSTLTLSSAPARTPPAGDGGMPAPAQKPPQQLMTMFQQQQHGKARPDEEPRDSPPHTHPHPQPHPHKALDQYRLQLYNYALNIERFRCPPYANAFANTGSRGEGGAPPAKRVADGADLGLPAAEHSPVAAAPDDGGGAAVYGTTAAFVAAAAAAASGYLPGQGGRPHPAAYAGQPFARGPHSMALSMSLFPARGIFQPEEPKPQHSYIGLIAMAILSSPDAKLVLSDIYQYILDHYPYFRSRGPGWRNSIRHNLSLNDCFVKSGRSANGKGHYWAIHPANIDDFRKGDFRRRKAQRKVRKHMGLSVDDVGADSPSPPPLALTPPPPAGLVQPVAAHPFAAAHHLAAAAAFGYLQQHHHQHHQRLTAFQQHQQHHYFGGGAFLGGVPRYVANAHFHQQHAQVADAHLHGFGGELAPAAALPLPHTEVLPPYPAAEPPVKLAAASRTTRTKIANLFSQTTRKRQFDVASLLADDDAVVQLDDKSGDEVLDEGAELRRDPSQAGKECCQTITIIDNVEESDGEGELTTTTEHTTVITKLRVQHQYQFRHQYKKRNRRGPKVARLPPAQLELEEQEDIDVEASDVEDNDSNLSASENDRSEESCDHAPEGCEAAKASGRQTPTGEQDSRRYSDSAHGLPTRASKALGSPESSAERRPLGAADGAAGDRAANGLQEYVPHELHSLHPLHPLKSAMGGHTVDTQIFGRYYGTYMAASRQAGPLLEPPLPKGAQPPYMQPQPEHQPRLHYQPTQHQQREHQLSDFKQGEELP